MRARAALLLLIVAAGAFGAGLALAPAQVPATRQVPTTFPVAQGQPFREPAELRSRNGVLDTTLTAADTTFDVGGSAVRGKGYQGTFIGPTLHVRPGDKIRIRLVNRLGEPTNLHEHGFHVSPIGISDNVLRTMPADSSNAVVVAIPRDMAPGTYWYHPHLHEIVEEQVFSGLAGVIVVDGLVGRLPKPLRTIPDRVMALKDLQVDNGTIPTQNIDSDAPTTRTINGLVDPRLAARTNQTQLLRLANISADIWYRLKADGARFHVIAEDANPAGRVWTADQLVLPPGKRYDVLVRWRSPGRYRLRTLRYSTGPDGDTYPERVLATIDVSGPPVASVAFPTSMGPLPHFEHATIVKRRRLTFNEDNATGRFFINGRQFDPRRVNEYVKLNTNEEWVLRNTSRELHPFHIHVNDFQVVSVNGRRQTAHGLQDTVPIPIGGRVVIRMRFRDFVGRYVFHCHILAHEDKGMMGIVDVTRTGRPPRKGPSDNRDMAMGGHHHHVIR